MKITLLIATLLVPLFAFAQDIEPQQQQESSLDRLLDRYGEQQKSANAQQDPESEIRKLRSQIIDLRVERDALSEENSYLKNQLETIQTYDEPHPECLKQECIPLDVVENERILSYVIYSLSLYRLAEIVEVTTPTENVEAHEQAQRVMAGVKSDLDTLGFDTTNMQDYPSLDELLKEFEIALTR